MSVYSFRNCERRNKDTVWPLLSLVITSVGRSEILHVLFASVFPSKVSQASGLRGTTSNGCGSNQGSLSKRNPCQSMGQVRWQPRELRGQANVTVRSLSIAFERSWRLRELPDGWQHSKVACTFQKWPKDEQGS